MAIRNAARGIIIHEGKILLNKNQNSVEDMFYGLPKGAIYYDFPGGGQNQYETLEEAVVRECIEETSYIVVPQKLVAILEEISENEVFKNSYEDYAHKVHFIFLCTLTGGRGEPLAQKDMDMIESQWIDLADIQNIPLYPKLLVNYFDKLISTDVPLYFGAHKVK